MSNEWDEKMRGLHYAVANVACKVKDLADDVSIAKKMKELLPENHQVSSYLSFKREELEKAVGEYEDVVREANEFRLNTMDKRYYTLDFGVEMSTTELLIMCVERQERRKN